MLHIYIYICKWFKCFHTYVASVFIWILQCLQWLHTCFQVFLVFSKCFRCVCKCFSYFRMFVASVLFECCKSRSDVAHVEWNPLAVAACCSWAGAPPCGQMVLTYGQAARETCGRRGPAWARVTSQCGKHGAEKHASMRRCPSGYPGASIFVSIVSDCCLTVDHYIYIALTKLYL
jgi:hypothetical protein